MGLSHPALRSAECHRTSGWLGVSWSTLSALVSLGLIAGWSCSRICAPVIVLAQDRSAVTCSLSHAGPPRWCTTRCPVSSGWSSNACTTICGSCGTPVATSRAVPRGSPRGSGWPAPTCTITHSARSCACPVAWVHWSSVVTSHNGVGAWGRGRRGSGHAMPRKAKAESDECPKIQALRARLQQKYGDTFFSGKPVFSPPVRGPYGKAKIRLKPDPRVDRNREFALRGERKEAMEKILREFIERGWLERCHSELASPCFVVPKKVAAEWRLVVDYRGLHAQTQHDSYTLPLIKDMLQKQHRRRIFTVIDLKHGYHQMPLAKESHACTAMSTPLGPLQWKVMPMGVTNGNAGFQQMLENLLESVRGCADPFVDDVIIASGDPSMSYEELLEAHERDVTRVLDLLVRHKLTGSSAKATIAVSEVVSTGHVVGNGRRKPIPGIVAAIEHCEKPKTVSELRAYLGVCNYYSGYIKIYAEYAAPMTTMLKGNREETKTGSKKALVWNEESDRAFEGMKQALLSAVGLHLVDPDQGFLLRTDASDYAVGAVLEQVLDDGRHVPVAFWSRVLAEGQRRTWTP